MQLLRVSVDEIPESCADCIFRPIEYIGTIGNTIHYCTLIHKIMPDHGRCEDCPLVVIEPDYIDLGC